MNAIEIVCTGCDAHMRLSESLLSRIAGRKGRVTCKQCENKVALDARGSALTVITGGVLLPRGVGDSVVPVGQVTTTPSSISELPASRSSLPPGPAVSAPPPLPEDLKIRRSLRQQARAEETARERQGHDDSGFEAPPPPAMRGTEDSLSPHTVDDEEDGLVRLGGDIQSSPFNPSIRDLTYQSLYPQTEARKPSAATPPESRSGEASRAPAPPQAGQLRRSSAPIYNPLSATPPEQLEGAVVVGIDGAPLNFADRARSSAPTSPPSSQRSSAAPWLVALVACFALGVSVATHPVTSGWLADQIGAGNSSAPQADLSSLSERATDTASPAAASMGGVELELWSGSAADSADSADTALEEVPATAVTPSASRSSSSAPPRSQAAAAPSSASDSASDSASSDSAAEVTPALSAITPDAPPASEPESELVVPFSSSAASMAMRQATMQAAGCRRPSDPSGQAQVSVTFAPSGRVTTSTVSGPPFAGTPTGGCIASQFRSSRVPAFTGEPVTVTRTVTIR